MLISNKYTVPDKCPEQCPLKKPLFSQSSICIRCPVLICKKMENDTEGYTPMVSSEEYREDWTKEWEEFFKTGTIPNLFL